MRSLDRVTVAGLFVMGLILCTANTWYAATRSTIPLGLNGQVSSMHVGTEKHPGVDDAYVIIIDDTRELRIDGSLFQALSQGDQLSKSPWQTELKQNNQTIALSWSQDLYGLRCCMSAALVLIAVMILFAPRMRLAEI